ncbi:MAG TPA: hypothetical protein VGQ73_00620, partial [Gemmatimonadales bacterium]|nr:hypothetical protein [Gemmatimonadales bacterium]
SRSVTGYRPTTAAVRVSPRAPVATRPRPASGLERPRPAGLPPLPRAPRLPVPAPRSPVGARERAGGWRKNERGEWVRTEAGEPPVPDTGEPRIVQKVRSQFALWAATSGGCFLLNIATGLQSPWFLFVAGFMSIGLLRNYSRLWQAGYSWRDVLTPPAAPDAVKVPGAKGKRMLGPPRREDYGPYFDRIEAAYKDRKMILALIQGLPASDRSMLPPEIAEPTDELYQRALELARTLNDIDTSFGDETPERIKRRLEILTAQPDGPERERQINIMEQQLKTASELMDRRAKIAARLESSILAMQNMRFDMLRLKSAGVGAVLSDITQATQQARAISRDVDHAIAAASEVREAMG